MKNLQGLIAFVETASAGSLTAAAAKLDVTPAAVSKSLAKLESQLGVRLLQRNTRRLAPTAEGEAFLHKARSALRDLDDAVAQVSQATAAPSGRVRISCASGFGRRWVLPVLPPLLLQYPELAVDVDLENRPVDLVAEGYDIGIRGGVIRDSSLVVRRVCALPAVLVASPVYLRKHGVPRLPQELGTHRCASVRFATSGVPAWRFKRGGSSKGPWEWTPPATLTTSDPDALAELALAGAGIVQTSLQHALPYLRSGRLKLVLTEVHDPGVREVVLHYPHRSLLAPRVRVVVQALLAHFEAASELHLLPRDLQDYAAAPASQR
jgi:DNA-binding transcriptional LysR family regulator